MLSEWDGADVMVSKRVHIGPVFVTPKFINVLRTHGWHRQPWFGVRNQKTESLYFGSWEVPGLLAANLDSDTWYQDTVIALKERYPDHPYIAGLSIS